MDFLHSNGCFGVVKTCINNFAQIGIYAFKLFLIELCIDHLLVHKTPVFCKCKKGPLLFNIYIYFGYFISCLKLYNLDIML